MIRYYVIDSGEDGIRVREGMTKEQLDRYLQERMEEMIQPTFLDRIPGSEQGYWAGVPDKSILILKAEIVVPKPKKVVTRYEID